MVNDVRSLRDNFDGGVVCVRCCPSPGIYDVGQASTIPSVKFKVEKGEFEGATL